MKRNDFYDGIGIPEKRKSPKFISERGKNTYYFFDEESLPEIKKMVKEFPLIGYPNNFIIGHEKNGQICFFWDALSFKEWNKKDRISNLNKAHTITFGMGNGFSETYIRRKK